MAEEEQTETVYISQGSHHLQTEMRLQAGLTCASE